MGPKETAEIDAAFREAFDRMPDTEAEIAEITRLAVASIEEDPWEPWW